MIFSCSPIAKAFCELRQSLIGINWWGATPMLSARQEQTISVVLIFGGFRPRALVFAEVAVLFVGES